MSANRDARWENVVKRYGNIVCYVVTDNLMLSDMVRNVCDRIGVQFRLVSFDDPIVFAQELTVSSGTFREGGMTVVVLDTTSLGEKALKIRNAWRHHPDTAEIPFLYLVNDAGLSRKFDPLHSYEEIRFFAQDDVDIELGIKAVVERLDYFRREVRT